MKKIWVLVFCVILLYVPIKSFACTPIDSVNVETLKDKAVSFLKWYLKEKENFSYRIVDGTEGDSVHSYRINYKNAKRYINFLGESAMLSSKYLNSLYAYFERCDANFIKYHQYYYIPFGFDMDLVIKTQDYYDIIPNVDKEKITRTIRRRKSIIIKVVFGNVTDQPFTFEFSEYNGIWLIDKINGDFDKKIGHTLPFSK